MMLFYSSGDLIELLAMFHLTVNFVSDVTISLSLWEKKEKKNTIISCIRVSVVLMTLKLKLIFKDVSSLVMKQI